MRPELQTLHHRVRVVDRLRQRHIEHRSRGPVEREPREFRVAQDADDPERVDVLRQIETEVTIERVLVALEEAADERFVHDGDQLRRAVVGGREVAAANELHSEVLEIVRTHAIP